MSDSNSSKRLQFGVSGPRMSFYDQGFGVSGHGSSYTARYRSHSLEFKKGDFDMGVKGNKNGFKASFGFNLFSLGYSNPSGSFKPSVSLGMGGGFGIQDDPVKKRTTFSVFKWGSKTGVEFSASHSSLEKFSQHMGTPFDPDF